MPNQKLGESSRKKIYLLIGPKGSGKTFIGSVLNRELGHYFLRVEDLALGLRKNRSIADDGYIHDVFSAIEEAVRKELKDRDELIFESTGLTDAFDQMLKRLQRDFTVFLIRIKADPDRCLARVKSRDQSIHIDVSDDQVLAINAQATGKKFDFCGEIDNNQANVQEIITTFERLTGEAI